MGGKLTISGRKVPNFGTFRSEIATFSLFFLIFPRFPSKTPFSRGNRVFLALLAGKRQIASKTPFLGQFAQFRVEIAQKAPFLGPAI